MGNLGANITPRVRETDIMCDSGDAEEDRRTRENTVLTSHQPSHMKAAGSLNIHRRFNQFVQYLKVIHSRQTVILILVSGMHES